MNSHVETLGVFVHGVLAALHGLGVVHNLRRRNWFDVAAHTAALVYDGWAVSKHMHALKEKA